MSKISFSKKCPKCGNIGRQRIRREWSAVTKHLPSTDDLVEYRERSAAIYSEVEENAFSGLLANTKKIKQLKDDIEKDGDEIQKYISVEFTSSGLVTITFN